MNTSGEERCFAQSGLPSQDMIKVRRKGGDSAWKATFRGEAEGKSQQVGTSHLGELEAAGRVIPNSQVSVGLFHFSLPMWVCLSNLLSLFCFTTLEGPLGKEE